MLSNTAKAILATGLVILVILGLCSRLRAVIGSLPKVEVRVHSVDRRPLHVHGEAHARAGMRILTLRGDNVVDVEDIYPRDARFIFFLSKAGVYYMDTTVGAVWQLTDRNMISASHFATVEKHMKELQEKWPD